MRVEIGISLFGLGDVAAHLEKLERSADRRENPALVVDGKRIGKLPNVSQDRLLEAGRHADPHFNHRVDKAGQTGGNETASGKTGLHGQKGLRLSVGIRPRGTESDSHSTQMWLGLLPGVCSRSRASMDVHCPAVRVTGCEELNCCTPQTPPCARRSPRWPPSRRSPTPARRLPYLRATRLKEQRANHRHPVRVYSNP